MKKLLLPFLVASFSIATAQTPCDSGMAGSYPCNGYDLQSHLTLSQMNASAGNDSWGWTDPQDGKEYALMGLNNGTAFIDVSDPVNPVYLGKLPTHTSSSSWRDIKVYNNYAFVVSEASGHGMQVFDLTRLRNVSNPPETFTEDAHYGGFGHSHNIVINEETGFAYSTGDNTYSGGAHFVNIQDPLNPVAAGGYAGSFYTHDAQVIVYNGPDTDHTGKEIFFGANENEAIIVDVTNKSNPQLIANFSYSNDGYTHQVWLTEDRNYLVIGDELDEQYNGFNTRTIIADLSDLDNPTLHYEYYGTTAAIDHNGYTKNGKYYLANYKAGLRVMDISDISNSNMSEVGFFDTHPQSNNANFDGVWNVYPYFGSGNIVISDISAGFFLVKSSAPDTENPVAVCQAYTAELDENGQVIVDASNVDGGSTDNSGSLTFALDTNSFDCSNLGANNVILTVTDPSGNTDTCSTTITVVDNTAPVFNCMNDQSATVDAGETFYTLPNYVTSGDVTATDNCTTTLSISQNPASGTQLAIGQHTITFETTDDEGNTANCSFELTVEAELANEDFNFDNGLSIYPNPTSSLITIDSSNELLTSIQIFDISGKQLFNITDLNIGTKTVDISSFAKGIYFISLNNKVTKKLVKN